jgi:hypothetical protein
MGRLSLHVGLTVAAGMLLSIAGVRAAIADCGCSGNPGTITADGKGPCVRYAAPSGPSNDITFRFDQTYGCGSYVTGAVGTTGRLRARVLGRLHR